MAKNNKVIKARTIASLRAKINVARSEGWEPKGEPCRIGGEHCVMVIRQKEKDHEH